MAAPRRWEGTRAVEASLEEAEARGDRLGQENLVGAEEGGLEAVEGGLAASAQEAAGSGEGVDGSGCV